MANNKNEKWIYAGAAAVVIVLLICFTGQPLKFLENQDILDCPGCNVISGGNDNTTLDIGCFGLLALDIKDRCCVDVPCPTCVLDRETLTCSGTCPVPPQWTGWTGACTLKTMVYGMECACEYLPPAEYTVR